MKTSAKFEPDVFRTFRQLTGVQLAFSALSVIAQRFALFGPSATTLSIFNLLWPGLLLLYLSLPSLQRSLKSFYLPIGIIWAAAGPILDPFMNGNNSTGLNADWLWRQTLLLFIPLIVVSLHYSMRQMLAFCALTTLLNLALIFPALSFERLASSPLIVIVLIQLIVYVFVGNMIVNLMRVQRDQWQRLVEVNKRLAQHASTVERLAVSQERNRLARELHDVLAHTLSGVAVELEGLRAMLHRDPEQARALLDHSLRAIREGLTETRRALQELRAKPLEDLGLSLAVQNLAESYTSRSDLQLELDIDHDLGEYPADVQQSVYRIAQEALANVADHAQAQNVRVGLKREHGELVLHVRDDGCGFDPHRSENENHYGLLGMHERAEMVGGKLSVESQPGKGTQISFRFTESQK